MVLRRAADAGRVDRPRRDGARGPVQREFIEEYDEDRSVELRRGDTLLLYTDGLTEAGAPEHVWSPDELAAAARNAARASLAATVDALVEAAIGSLPAVRDDVAVLALRPGAAQP
jgi:serine phosphatase RsbU (regulator of sigma subunit)